MYSAQLYKRNGPFSGSSPDSIIGLSSKRGCLTGSSLVPMTTRVADDEEPAPEPQPTRSPPAAAVPAISLSASRRDMRRRQGDLSLGWNATSLSTSFWGVRPRPPVPTPRPRVPPPARRPLAHPSAQARRSPTLWKQRQDTTRWQVLRSPRGRRTAPGAQGRP